MMGITATKREKPLGSQGALDSCRQRALQFLSFHSWTPQVGEYNSFLTLCSHLICVVRYLVFNVKVLTPHLN